MASSVLIWLKEKDEEGFQEVVLFSDSCGGQNRNRIMCTALIWFLYHAKYIIKIEQKFFESGHSQSEGDSMHSATEGEIRNTGIYLPSGYQLCMVKANKRMPYKVKELTSYDILDFDQLNKEYMKTNCFKGISKMHHITYTKLGGQDETVSLSEELGGQQILIDYKRRGRNKNWKTIIPQTKVSDKSNIDSAKKEDLKKLMAFLPEDCQQLTVQRIF